VQHQCKQPDPFRFLREKFSNKTGQEQGFFSEIAARQIRSTRVGPALSKGGVDGVQHGIEPAAKFFAFGNAKWNPGLADLVLGAHQPLAHGRRRHEEC
jgi:hypothetical protein